MKPKLSDYGLFESLWMKEIQVFPDVRGTIGYMDPEYFMSGEMSSAAKSSVTDSSHTRTLSFVSNTYTYCKEVLILEKMLQATDVVMGKRPVTDFQDPRIRESITSADFESILQTAVVCTAREDKSVLPTTPSKSLELVRA
ncbi:UNVERIFIED_CONTAM: hypothetical protein Scaly_2806100 [Sesamum calycinum]|uniref:Uncharacterized protein n=1 Tax=Sesamum calycinum TaxID=2727403 RepID=A0AAW2IWR3_9LAMI